jgi:DNA repair protein RadD
VSLRPYQQRAINDLYTWLSKNEGHPCLVLPTGSGKSHIIAELCRDALQSWPETRILMLTHQKELIEQNAAKLRAHWPNVPLGIYSASIGRKDLGEPITFAGIQSVRTKAAQLGHIDLVLIDECHLVSHKDEGSYRSLLRDLAAINEHMRAIGLTATPWRLGHGLITDKPAIFDDLIEPVSIEELVYHGFLSPLRSKVTGVKYDLTGVAKRGGEYVEGELARAVNTEDYNSRIAAEIVSYAQGRKSWLVFCTGIDHAKEMAAELSNYTSAAYITGETPKAERERLLADFKAGRIQVLTNANVLTTGFDAPNIDLIAMLRPTMSPSLYVQMAGRGCRIADGKTDCLVLDFAGVVERHGPITAIQPPSKAGEGKGEAPTKSCEECWELVHISAKVCPACGAAFPDAEPKEADLRLRNDDIMGLEATEMVVIDWRWAKHTSRTSGKDMLAVTYYGGLSDKPVREYFPILHGGYASEKAARELGLIAGKAGVSFTPGSGLEAWVDTLERGQPPSIIKYRMDGKYHRVTGRSW